MTPAQIAAALTDEVLIDIDNAAELEYGACSDADAERAWAHLWRARLVAALSRGEADARVSDLSRLAREAKEELRGPAPPAGSGPSEAGAIDTADFVARLERQPHEHPCPCARFRPKPIGECICWIGRARDFLLGAALTAPALPAAPPAGSGPSEAGTDHDLRDLRQRIRYHTREARALTELLQLRSAGEPAPPAAPPPVPTSPQSAHDHALGAPLLLGCNDWCRDRFARWSRGEGDYGTGPAAPRPETP